MHDDVVRQEVSGLTEAEREELDALRALRDNVETLKPFIDRSDPRHPSPVHAKEWREVFERSRVRPTRTLVTGPPRHAKTWTVKHGLAYSLTYDPAVESSYVSAGAQLSIDKSVEVRDIVRRNGGGVLGRQNNWRTPQGGRLIALGIGGQYNGTGTTGMQVVDDPFPTASHALSPNYRKKVIDFKEGTADNRLEGGASQLIFHTRFHPRDLIGHLLATEPERWNHIHKPAVLGFDEAAADNELRKERERQDIKRRYRAGLLERGTPIPEQLQPDYPSWAGLRELALPVSDELRPDLESIGRALWPEYWPIARLLPLMRHKRWWAALYMGNPRPDGAQVFYEPARFLLADWRTPDGFRLVAHRVGIGGDPAATESQTADHSAAVLMAMQGYGNATRAWVLDVYRQQVQTTTFAQVLVRWQRKYRCAVHVEAVAGFRAVPQVMNLVAQLSAQQWKCRTHGVVEEPRVLQTLRSDGAHARSCTTCGEYLEIDTGALRVEEAPALGGKLLRASPMAATWNDGRVLVPQDASWADGYIQRHLDFTGLGDEEDDEVDAGAHVFNALYRDRPDMIRGPREALSLPFG
jgi:predicted phage terminase large subunit-like protein